MKNVNKIWFCLCCLVAFALVMTVSSVPAAEVEKLTGRKFSLFAWGGVLYDNWPDELYDINWPKKLMEETNKTHPSYPANGKQKGVTTWRCKECHGWDYKGKLGAYSKGSHYTGIKGIRAYANEDIDEIMKILKNDTHAIKDKIPGKALKALALFVSAGQMYMDPYIDRTTKKALGDPANGGKVFLTVCIKCHGEDGRDIDFSNDEKPEYIGTLANKNPWEVLHKIRWGHPASVMIPLFFLDLKEQLDVLAFCQTLPEK